MFSLYLFLQILQISQENTCVGVRPATLLGRETPTQLFSCEICKSFMNTFFCRALPVPTPVYTSLFMPLLAYTYLQLLIYT